MKSQKEYFDSLIKISKSSLSKKAHNPQDEALEQLKILIPDMGEAQPYAEHMLDQVKVFFQMSEKISDFLNKFSDSSKSVDDWQEALRDQINGINKTFDSGMENPMIDPQTLFKNFDQQEYIHLWMDYQRANLEYKSIQQIVSKETIERFMQKLLTKSEQEETLDSMREVYDLWIDCAEEAYADLACSDEYKEVFGRMVNSLMALKQETRNMVDDAASSLGLPSSKDFNTVLKRMQEMHREIRLLQRSASPSNEITELRDEVADLHKKLTELKRAATSKPVISNIRKSTMKKKVSLSRNKVVRKK